MRAVHRRMRKPHELKFRHYTDWLIGSNDYVDAFPGAKESDNIGERELNKIILNSIPNGCMNQAHMQGFYCETITP